MSPFYSYGTVSERTSCRGLHRLCSTKAASFRILVLPSICLKRKIIGNLNYQNSNEMVRKETAVNEKKRRKIPMVIFFIKKYL